MYWHQLNRIEIAFCVVWVLATIYVLRREFSLSLCITRFNKNLLDRGAFKFKCVFLFIKAHCYTVLNTIFLILSDSYSCLFPSPIATDFNNIFLVASLLRKCIFLAFININCHVIWMFGCKEKFPFRIVTAALLTSFIIIIDTFLLRAIVQREFLGRENA